MNYIYYILIFFVGYVFFAVISLWIIRAMDRHWYKHNPGAKKEFSRTDDQLRKSGH